MLFTGRRLQATKHWFGLVGLVVLGSTAVGTEAAAQSVALRGFVTDASNGQPLPGANVALQDTLGQLQGAVADADGYYQVGGLLPGRYVLRASFVGYEAFVDTLVLGADRFVTRSLALTPAQELLDEVVVETEGGATRVEAGQQTIRPADLARIPTPDPSGDLAGYLQTLPGVVSLGDRGGQLYIRGGTPAHNLVLVDGLPILQPFHIIGFFSAFPEDLVSNVELFAGGFGAKYSGRLSSVIDVTMREGNKQRFEGAASFSPFLTAVRLEGPLRSEGVSLIGSVRRSVVERVGPLLLREDLPFRFGDAYLKLHDGRRENSRLSLTALHTYDRGRIDPTTLDGDVFRWNNFVLSGRALVFPTASPVLFEANSGISYFTNAVGEVGGLERTSQTFQLSSAVNLTRFFDRRELRVGFFARANWFAYQLSEQFLNVRARDDMVIGAGGYVEVDQPLGPHLKVTPGLAATVYPFRYRPAIEPRFRFTWQPGGADGAHTVSGALGIYRQTLVGISDERDAGSVFMAWLPSPLADAQPRATHALLGWQVQAGAHVRLLVEGYYKKLSDLPVPIWSTVARFTTRLMPADGDAYGADTRIEFQRRPFYAFVGYGWSRTAYTAAQDNFGLWFGEPVQRYHPPHDRRHQVNALVSFQRGRFTTSLRWQFGSGLPFTQPIGFDDLIPLRGIIDVRAFYGTPRVLYEKPYRGRLPTYHRLDFSAERSFGVAYGILTLQAGFINLYDRANLFYFDVFSVRRVDQLPLLPFVAFKLETN